MFAYRGGDTSVDGEMCVLTWGGGGDEGVEEFVAGGKEGFQSGVQGFDGVEDDGLLRDISFGLSLGLLCENQESDGINLSLQVCELLVHLATWVVVGATCDEFRLQLDSPFFLVLYGIDFSIFPSFFFGDEYARLFVDGTLFSLSEAEISIAKNLRPKGHTLATTNSDSLLTVIRRIDKIIIGDH